MDRTVIGHLTSPVGLGPTRLLNAEGFMCCLGQICEQLGVPRSELNGVIAPHKLANEESIERIKGLLVLPAYRGGYELTGLAGQAVYCNDCSTMKMSAREEAIKSLFAEQEISIEFVGEPVIPAREEKHE